MPERPKDDKSDRPLLSRLEKLKADKGENYAPDMPPVDGGEYLLGYLFEVGPTLAAGMGAGPITQQELRAWQLNLGLTLGPWEVRCLRRLSIEYLNQSHKSEKRDCPAPWKADDVKPETSSTQAALRALAQL